MTKILPRDNSQTVLDSHFPAHIHRWPVLQIYNGYRLFLALSLVLSFLWASQLNTQVGMDGPRFFYTSTLWLGFALIAIGINANRWPNFWLQVNLGVWWDMVTLIILNHASVHLPTNLGIFLIITVAAQSVLIPGKLAIFNTAMATMALLGHQLYVYSIDLHTPWAIFQTGVLGAVMFFTAWLTQWLAQKVDTSQSVALETEAHLETSQKLNAVVIAQLESGVLVLDAARHIVIMNQACRLCLGLSPDIVYRSIEQLPNAFEDRFKHWLDHHQSKSHLRVNPHTPECRLSFHALGKALEQGTLIFFEDLEKAQQQAQNLKLASLGHLTANIAHELRNPLATVTHACALLNESIDRSPHQAHLVALSLKHCKRMNTVIQNVLSLSRRRPPQQASLDLTQWLQDFIQDLHFPHLGTISVELEVGPCEARIWMDPDQLHQALINICENGLRYSLAHSGIPYLKIIVKKGEHNDATFIDIQDKGKGIPLDTQKHIFDPFFTTESQGSGLGLFMAKELCHLNGSDLLYMPLANGGSQFRMIFKPGEWTT